MNPDFARPSSIPSIKRLARAIQAAEGCKYSDALNAAAQRAGHASFHAAIHASSCPAPTARHSVTIIDHWRDIDAKEAGVVELTLQLSHPLRDLVRPHHLQGRLNAYKIIGTDTLAGQITIGGRESTAKWFAARTGRCLQFMDATGLKPSRKHSNIWPDDDTDKRVPGADHYVVWYHPELETHVISDEPYHGHVRHHDPERRQWCDEHGYVIEPVTWAGMHNPAPDGGTVLYLIAKAADRKIVRRLAELANQLPDVITEDAVVATHRRPIRLVR